MFVRYDCGCVGVGSPLTVAGIKSQTALVCRICDSHDSEDLCFSFREMSDKDFVSLSEVETKELAKELNALVIDGYRYREIRRLLRIPNED